MNALLLLASLSSAASSAAPPPVVVHFVLKEMRIVALDAEPGEPVTLEAGRPYELRFANRGQLQHEVALGRGPRAGADGPEFAEALLVGLPVAVRAGGVLVESLGLEELELRPEGVARVAFTLPDSAAGDWELACFMPGHLGSGMRLPLRVRRAAVSAAR